MNEHQYNPHDLEREYDSFTANIGADADGNERAHLYSHPEYIYIGCISYDPTPAIEDYAFVPVAWPLGCITRDQMDDIKRVADWMEWRRAVTTGKTHDVQCAQCGRRIPRTDNYSPGCPCTTSRPGYQDEMLEIMKISREAMTEYERFEGAHKCMAEGGAE